MEDGNRTICIHSEILQAFFMIGESGEAVDFLVQCFIGFGNILTYHFETHYIADIVTLRYDESPEPDKRSVFPPVAYIACPGSSGSDGGQEIIPKFSGLHSGTEYTHIFPDKFFLGVSRIFYHQVIYREDRSIEIHVKCPFMDIENVQLFLYG